VSNGLLYLADLGGGGALEVLNPSNPSNIVRVAKYYTASLPSGLDVKNGYAYVADSSYGVRVIDVHVPSSPFTVGRYDGQANATSWSVATRSNFAYVADGPGGLQVLDISNPMSPSRVTNLPTSAASHKVVFSGTRAFVTDLTDGLRILDISDLSSPTTLSFYRPGHYVYDVAVQGNYAYVANNTNGLQIVNVSSPSFPVRVATYQGQREVRAVTVQSNRVFLSGSPPVFGGALEIVDVSIPASPVLLGRYAPLAVFFRVVVAGKYAFLAGTHGFEIVDVSNPANVVPVFSKTNDPTGASYAADSVAVSGEYAYVGWDQGLEVLKITNPTNPVPVGFMQTRRFSEDIYGEVLGITVEESRIYFALRGYGLRILCSWFPVQYSGRVTGTAGTPLTIETTTGLSAPVQWTPLLTTNVPDSYFDFVDHNVVEQKFYRVRQP
jgi:hypothetical protein